ncbi:hypothetical protein AB1K56_01175 [Microbacterium sp. BWR-S6Y]|uniref:hypothetical protein n=1 Tax=Microbacterium sp. BWR-S6Y TaxID=3232073 RepID=UPI00352788B2
MHGGAHRIIGSVAIGLAALLAAGCGVMHSPESNLEDSLARMVEGAQDSLWPYRADIVSDPEAAVARVGSVSDVRPAYVDPAFVPAGGTYKLLGVTTSAEGTSLILATSGGSETGGGLFYDYRSAAVCFELRFPAGERRIDTLASDCTDGQGHGLADVAEVIDYTRHGEPRSIDGLDVRRTVTAEDYPTMPCQCSSGGTCDCPGG